MPRNYSTTWPIVANGAKALAWDLSWANWVTQKYLRIFETNYPNRLVSVSMADALKDPDLWPIREMLDRLQCGIIRLCKPLIGETIPHAIRPRCPPISPAKAED